MQPELGAVMASKALIPYVWTQHSTSFDHRHVGCAREPVQDAGSVRQLLLEVTAENAVASCSTFLLAQNGQEIFCFSCSAKVMIFSNGLLQFLQMYS